MSLSATQMRTAALTILQHDVDLCNNMYIMLPDRDSVEGYKLLKYILALETVIDLYS